tara:strand:- start:227 stop:478 length:252 start_codon:yes stop_codon:yes gene_type:complete
MESLGVSSKVHDCVYFDLDDHLNEFDSIIDSLMHSDIQRHQVRLAIADWCASVDVSVNEIEAEQYETPDQPTLLADEIFGTET